MSSKNFMAYGDAETILTGFANKINANTKGVAEQKVLLPSTVGWTGKNQIVYPYVFSYDSLSGVTFTVMSDGTIKLNNTANASINKALHFRSGYSEGTTVDNYPVVLKAGSYIVSKGQNENVSIRINKTVSGSASNIVVLAANEESASFTISEDTQIGILLDIASGASFSDTIIHPMIRDSRITDPTYEPYHKSVEECLEDINDKLSYLEQSVTLSTSTSTTVTFTDSSITANSFIEYACSQWDLVPESITGAAGSCTIVLPKVDSAQSVTVRIYVR